jgi:general secretion pathway protein A
VRAELFAAVKTLAGLVVLTGEAGTGKTMLLSRLTRDVEAAGHLVYRCSVALILDPPLATLARQLGIPEATAPGARHEALLAALQAQARPEGTIVVAVDEAQHLGCADLEELRAFTEVAASSGMRLVVLLAGQPELDLKLATLGRAGGTPAHVLRAALPRLAASEVRRYVAYRLGLTGARVDDVFQPDAIERITAYAEGIPRLVNHLCDAALLKADQAGIARLSAPIVDAAARRIALPFPERGRTRDARRARRGAPRPRSARAAPGRAAARGWWAGAGIAVVTAVTAVLFAPRETSHPPPLPAPAEAPQSPSVAADAGAAMPAETARVLPPAPPTAPERSVEPRSAGRAKVPREPSTRGGTDDRPASRLASPAAPPSGTRMVSPMALALLDSAEAGKLTEVQALLAAGLSPDARDAGGMTPLMLAVTHDHGAVAEVLLARGADFDASDGGGVTALMLAANNGRTALLQRLINRGANVNARTGAGWTALTYAAWHGHAAGVRRLLEAGANPAFADRIGWTALQYATWRAAEVSQARPPDPADPLAPENPEPAEAARLRYAEVVRLLGAATVRR